MICKALSAESDTIAKVGFLFIDKRIVIFLPDSNNLKPFNLDYVSTLDGYELKGIFENELSKLRKKAKRYKIQYTFIDSNGRSTLVMDRIYLIRVQIIYTNSDIAEIASEETIWPYSYKNKIYGMRYKNYWLASILSVTPCSNCSETFMQYSDVPKKSN